MNDTKFLTFYKDMLIAAQKNSTCKRLQVAAIIVKDGRVINSGWNGSLPKAEHCMDKFKDMSTDDPLFYQLHGEWSAKYESHAEISAIATAAKLGIPIGGWEIAISYTPCLPCAKAIVMAGLTKVYYLHKYDRDPEGLSLLMERNIPCIQM